MVYINEKSRTWIPPHREHHNGSICSRFIFKSLGLCLAGERQLFELKCSVLLFQQERGTSQAPSAPCPHHLSPTPPSPRALQQPVQELPLRGGMRDHESHGAEAHKYLQAMFIYRPEERGCSASVPLLPTWCRATEAARPLSGCQEDKRPPGALTVLGLRARGVLAGPSSACRGRESPGGCMSPHPASHHVPAVTTSSVLPAPCCPGLLRGDGALQEGSGAASQRP